MTISLRKSLALILTAFVCLTLFVLSVVITVSSRKLFAGFVMQKIESETAEIINSITGQYSPFLGTFNDSGLDSIGMHYMHKGFFVLVKNNEGQTLWNVRSINSAHCLLIVEEIQTRMRNVFNTVGAFKTQVYPIAYNGINVGSVAVESYGPFFYSENDAAFIKSLNNIFALCGIVFAALSIMLSFFISAALSKPVSETTNAARCIANGDFSVRVIDNKKKKKKLPKVHIEELSLLSASINDLASALENGEEWQKRLSSDIAHELRTPLTALQGNIEGMLDRVFEPSEKRLTVCKEEIERINNLVSQLNSLSILEKENLVLRKTDFDISLLLQSVSDQFSPLASAKNIQIRTDLINAPIHGDREKLKQVFINIMSNAIKYTDEGTINVSIKSCGLLDSVYEITVSDTGIGIPPQDLPHIFKRFYRADKSRNRGTGGAGIGLSIVAAIIKAHGGTVMAENIDGGGAKFTVNLLHS